MADHDLDSVARGALGSLAADVAATTAVAPAGAVRAAAERRHRRRTAAALVTAAVVVVGGVVGGVALAGGWNEPQTLVPAAPTASPSPSPSPAAVQSIPPGLRLPDEGRRAASSDVTDWETTRGLGTPWALLPCGPSTGAGAEGRTDFREVAQSGPEYHATRQLGVHASTADAEAVMAAFRRDLARCAERRTDDSGETVTRFDWGTLDGADEGLWAVQSYHLDAGQVPGAVQVVVLRVGNAVLLVSLADEATPTRGVEEPGLQQVASVARGFASELCPFSETGC